MYKPYEQNRNDALTRYVEHVQTQDGHSIRINVPVQIRQHVADGPGVAFVQLCHDQTSEVAAIDATIARFQATIEELEQIRRAKNPDTCPACKGSRTSPGLVQIAPNVRGMKTCATPFHHGR